MSPSILQKIKKGEYKNIVFYGMGCSSVVSDVMKGFLKDQGIEMDVHVVNDYEYGGVPK